MKLSYRIIAVAGLCMTGISTMAGCAADRTQRFSASWPRIFFPFRTAKDVDKESTEGLAEATEAPQSGDWRPSDRSDRYYSPGNPPPVLPQMPPKAPPAAEPGYLNEDGLGSTHNTSGIKPSDGRPARLRDVFDNWRRHESTEPQPAIPLHEPVAKRPRSSGMRVVGFEQNEPVVLGRPEFDAFPKDQ